MKNLIIVGILAYAGYYYYNKTPSLVICETVEDVKIKEYEVGKTMLTGGVKLNKRRNNGTRELQEIIRRLDLMQRRGYPHPQDACDAYNELLDELQ